MTTTVDLSSLPKDLAIAEAKRLKIHSGILDEIWLKK